MPTTTLAASAGVAALVGPGTISPPLTVVNQNVSGGFNSVVVLGAGAFGTTPTVINDLCTLIFASSPPGDSLATGQGTASATCSGTAAISVSLSYLRVGSTMLFTGTRTVNGTAAGMSAACGLVPTSNPVSTYEVACAAVFGP